MSKGVARSCEHGHPACAPCRRVMNRAWNTAYMRERRERDRGAFNAARRARRAADPALRERERIAGRKTSKERWYRQTYQRSLGSLRALFTTQGSCCDICCKPLRFPDRGTHLDHNHATGAVRAFLCSGCNRGLGYFKDNAETLEAAADYLRRFE